MKTTENSADASSSTAGVRIPNQLKAQLAEHAELNGRSLNAEMAARLQASVDRRGSPGLRLLAGRLKWPRVMRIRSENTSEDVQALAELPHVMGADGLVLAARPDDLNGAVLVVLIESPHAHLLLDSSYLNMARRPRISEMEDLFSRWKADGLIGHMQFCPNLVADTRELPAEEAAKLLIEKATSTDLGGFLKTLSRHGLFDLEKFQ
jgi:hypothetical protein